MNRSITLQATEVKAIQDHLKIIKTAGESLNFFDEIQEPLSNISEVINQDNSAQKLFGPILIS